LGELGLLLGREGGVPLLQANLAMAREKKRKVDLKGRGREEREREKRISWMGGNCEDLVWAKRNYFLKIKNKIKNHNKFNENSIQSIIIKEGIVLHNFQIF